MTERPLPNSTQSAIPVPTAFHSTTANPVSDARSVIESAEEEPYTIKCICDYRDDDGNTIYCEKCDTWQHIECFYPGQVDDASKEEFDHSCADCKPRPLTLDRHHATERQTLRRHNKAINDGSDKKTKRPPSKSHKKKTKPSDLQVNGHHDHSHHKHASPSEHHPHTKKSKGHRSTQSISSQMKRSPPLNGRPQNHAHPPSPAHTPPEIGNLNGYIYNDRFINLHAGDESKTTSTNSFASLSVSNRMGLWLQSPEILKEDANAIKDDIFQVLTVPVDSLKWPALKIDTKDIIQEGGPNLTWRSVRNSAPLTEAGRICPIHGVIKFQVEYCSDPQSRWAEAGHPQPFVIFHPQLPLVIDMRTEGSQYRYVRRSCRPNTALETFLAHDTEYHFWLTSEQPLAANEQVTIQWDFRFPNNELGNRYKRLLNLGEEERAVSDVLDVTDEEYEDLSNLVLTVLSDHGGCACDLGSECAFARFHRDYIGRSHTHINGVKPKKGRKTKHAHISPTSTGHATNSRAASEGQGDQYDDDDNQSVSGSVRSKPHSRDMTPLHNGEPNGITTENSEREKRKLAALEDSFRKMEQQPPRKKKRVSEGSNMSVSSHVAPKQRQRSVIPRASISQASAPATNGGRAHKYVDANTATRRPSGSPSSTTSATNAVRSPENHASPSQSMRSRHSSANPKTTYAEASTQTEEVKNAWWHKSSPKPKRRSILTLAQRLLKNRRTIQQGQQEARAAQQTVSTNGGHGSVRASPTESMDLDPPNNEDRLQTQPPTETKARNMSVASSTPPVDPSGSVEVAIVDAPAVTSATTTKPPPPPWPTPSDSVSGSKPVSVQRSQPLRVQLPSAPVFPTTSMSAPLSGTGTATPSSASSTGHSPFGNGHFPPAFPTTAVNSINPSPIKTTKKLSLSDYAARRKKTEPSAKPSTGSSPTIPPAVLKPSLSTIDEAKAQGGLEGSAIVESPAAIEKTLNPLAAVAGPTSGPSRNGTLPAEKSNGTL
ncbi:related to SET3 SET3 complex includes two histone deacetylases, Hos2 and Hst1, and is a meiotic-specific repressor of the sporulation gene program [Rhynchosporium secalis]|uniref:Related to SET3 SET3 complex includes two histone deacetylases, Hos2 and Hst1, and is a meiotic-specific repressor of the sporulation gene program n=1 Tax=Rhynchosporium secalis TaxID=38038 RepID=A0A1E1MJ18_RHYSE|nr:related to SET3 SET3 complex includes two histone deacetylases, Hos2 and Hst1, and is a meiotic-specific repressor of the sporulation gene program [Rhynchosporium secalis]